MDKESAPAASRDGDGSNGGAGGGGGSRRAAPSGALDPLLAGYFSKVVLGLFGSASGQQMASFLMERPNLVHAILRHVGSYSIKEMVKMMNFGKNDGFCPKM